MRTAANARNANGIGSSEELDSEVCGVSMDDRTLVYANYQQ